MSDQFWLTKAQPRRMSSFFSAFARSHRPHERQIELKLHAVCEGAPAGQYLSSHRMSDHKGAALIYPMLPDAATRPLRPHILQCSASRQASSFGSVNES
jgi:hypothetical protein